MLSRRIEREALVGAGLETAREHAVDTPALASVYALVRQRAAILGCYP